MAHLLLVEDHPHNAEIARIGLTQAGHTVVHAWHGGEAIHRLTRGERFDAIVTDIQMPEVDGLQLIRFLKRHAETVRLPILALTARVAPAEQNAMRQAGADRVLSKPYRMRDLQDQIRALLGHVSKPLRRSGSGPLPSLT